VFPGASGRLPKQRCSSFGSVRGGSYFFNGGRLFPFASGASDPEPLWLN
jgi:hypothetical protein